MAKTIQYLAGLFDGEGTMTINVSYRTLSNGEVSYYSTPYVSICNTNMALVRVFADRWGGTVTTNCNKKIKAHHKQVYRWETRGQLALKVAIELEPELIAKQAQARLAIVVGRLNAANKQKPGMRKGVYKADWKKFAEQLLVGKMRELNQRGLVA